MGIDDFSIEEILDKMGVPYKISSDNRKLKVLCPFHNDTKPSFSIYRGIGSDTKGYCRCFSCGKNVFINTYCKQVSGRSVYEVLGLDKESEGDVFLANTNKNTVQAERSFSDIEIEGKLKSPYDNKRVLDFLYSISMTNSFIDNFDVKYFDFIIINGMEMFNRIAIPCYYDGKLVNLECRDFTGKSNKKMLYPPGCYTDFLFNFENLDQNKEKITVEGIKGLAKVWTSGYKNIVSSFSKNIKRNQWKQYNRYKDWLLLPDNDKNKLDDDGNPVDTIGHMIDQWDENYNWEYKIGEIKKIGADPADLSKKELDQIILSAKSSTQLLMELNFSKEEEIPWI